MNLALEKWERVTTGDKGRGGLRNEIGKVTHMELKGKLVRCCLEHCFIWL